MISCVISAAALKLKQIHVLSDNFMDTMGAAVTAQQVVREPYENKGSNPVGSWFWQFLGLSLSTGSHESQAGCCILHLLQKTNECYYSDMWHPTLPYWTVPNDNDNSATIDLL